MTVVVRIRLAGAVLAMMVGCLTACGDDDDGAGAAPTPVPGVGTLVGAVEGGDVYVALISDGERVVGYLCDDGKIAAWLAPAEIDNGRAQLVSRDGKDMGDVEIGADGASGSVEVAGQSLGFAVIPASGDAGVFRATAGTAGEPGSIEAGWITLADGSTKGATKTLTEGDDFVIGLAPELPDGGAGFVDLGGGEQAEVHELGPEFIVEESER